MTLTRRDFIWPREKTFFAHSEKVILIADADVFFPPPNSCIQSKLNIFSDETCRICCSLISDYKKTSTLQPQFVSLVSFSS